MKELALYYYGEGYSCSKCIILAAKDTYGRVTKSIVESVNGINNGYGVGSFCSAITAVLIILGLFYDEDQLKEKRMELICGFQENFCSINCSHLTKDRSNCEAMISFVCDYLEKTIKV
ncbi:MAG: C-GCAxxG-C-C family (seleno)protein [Anaerotignaceae bacterium]